MRRLLALGVAAGLAVVVALPGAAFASRSMVTTASPTTSATPTPSATGPASPSPTPAKTPAAKKPATRQHASGHHSGTTVFGPHMCICSMNPTTGAINGKHFPYPSTVTVSQTTNLVNQMVTVRWTGFTPSQNPPYNNTSTDYPVMVAQCRGAHPTTPNQCLYATAGGSVETSGVYGPGNAAYAVTDQNGTGQTEILLYTAVQNQFLGCDATHACSLVIVDAQGGNSLNYVTGKHPHNVPLCNDHSQDSADTDLAQYSFGNITSGLGQANGYCSWQKRIVIPLHFAPTPNGCPTRAYDFTSGGAPMLARTMLQWQIGECFGSSPITLQYNSSVNESEARDDFASGLEDVAFTTQPMTEPTKHPYTYAPVAVSAAALSYWVDNSNTQLPYTSMKMDPRLVAKLLTTSYNFDEEACPGAKSYPFGCDNSIDNNPFGLYYDPEFLKLNPSMTPLNVATPNPYQVVTVVAGDSDITWTTTGWIAANKDASEFLAGQFDPWGMHINTYYLGLQYPTDSIVPADPYIPLSVLYSPTYPLSSVAMYQSENWAPGTDTSKDPATGNYDTLNPETPGDRDLFALTDESDAASFLFPTVALENAAGKFVQPTDAGMAAAVNDMTVSSNGITRSMNFAKRDPAAYPLTMIIYAVVPTGGISAAKAAKIAQFLDFVANKGQVPGTAPGDLASGFLPLPNFLRQQTLAAAYKVLHQTGDPKKPATHTKSPSPSPSPSRSASASKSPKPTPSPSRASSPSASASATPRSIAVSFSRPDVTGMSWVVLALLIAGLVLIVAGPAALVYGSPAARAAIGTSARRVRRLSRRPQLTRYRPGWNRSGSGRTQRGTSRSTWRRNS